MKKKMLIFFALILLAPDLSPRLMGHANGDAGYASDYMRADSLYYSGYFQQALLTYQKLPVNNNPQTQFKMAYSAYRSGEYARSGRMFRVLYKELQFLEPFSGFFYTKNLWRQDSTEAAGQTLEYIDTFENHALADSFLFPLAEYNSQAGRQERAVELYRKAAKKITERRLKIKALIRAGEAALAGGLTGQAEKYFYSVLKKYPKDKQVQELISVLRKKLPDFVEKHFFSVVHVYSSNKQYGKAKKLLEAFIKSQAKSADKEKARFRLLTVYYYQGHYRNALYGFERLKFSKVNSNLEDDRQLFLARCNRKLGRTNKAIQIYLRFAEHYPQHRKAAEAVWQSAWLYERLGNPNKAIALYKQLCRRWPRNALCARARFKEGFIYYNQHSFSKANRIFSKIRLAARTDFERNRAQYWSALCMEQLGMKEQANDLRKAIAQNLWDDYYTMRSYLLHKNELDTTLHFIKEFKQTSNPLLYYAGGIGKRLADFEKALQVQELLGSEFGRMELERLKPSLHSLPEWIALAEFYKKFKLYGEAYRTYDYINRRFFNNLSYVEKAFMLKERFPLYYDNEIEKYSRRYKLEKELVLALIKQESVFVPMAHSYANAYGLMQLIPPTANDMASLAGLRLTDPKQLFNPDFNIHLGALYLKLLTKQFKGRKEHMLAAYNAGPHRVQRWLKKPDAGQTDIFVENIEFSETRNYVRKVLKNYWAYKILNKNFAVDPREMLGFNGK